jgi:hypothetical protein
MQPLCDQQEPNLYSLAGLDDYAPHSGRSGPFCAFLKAAIPKRRTTRLKRGWISDSLISAAVGAKQTYGLDD